MLNFTEHGWEERKKTLLKNVFTLPCNSLRIESTRIEDGKMKMEVCFSIYYNSGCITAQSICKQFSLVEIFNLKIMMKWDKKTLWSLKTILKDFPWQEKVYAKNTVFLSYFETKIGLNINLITFILCLYRWTIPFYGCILEIFYNRIREKGYLYMLFMYRSVNAYIKLILFMWIL